MALELVGLELVLLDKDFQEGLKRYYSGIQKAVDFTEKAMAEIGVAWDDTFKTFRYGGIAISQSQVVEKLQALRREVLGLKPELSETAIIANNVFKRLDDIRLARARTALAGAFGGPTDAPETLNRTNAALSKTQGILGMTRREWLRTGSEAAFYARTAIGQTGALNRSLSEGIGIVTQLGESFIYGNAVGMGIAAASMAIGFFVKQLQAAEEEAKKLQQPFADVRKEISAIVELKGLAGLAKEIGVTEAQLRDYIGLIGDGEKAVSDFNNVQESSALLQAELTKKQEELAYAQKMVRETEGDPEIQNAYVVQIQTLTPRIAELNSMLANNVLYLNRSKSAIKENTSALAEQKRVAEIQAKAVFNLASAQDDYTAAVAKLNAQHSKTMQGFVDDETKARDKALEDWQKNQTDAAGKVAETNEKLLADISEMEQDHLGKETEAYRDYILKVQDLDRDIIKSAEDTADELEQIKRDTVKQLNAISQQAATDEMTASTWAEVMLIRRKAEQKRREVMQDESARMTETQKKAREQQAEYALRRRLMDDEYRHSQELGDAELRKSIERAQADANQQIQQAWKTAGEQGMAIGLRLENELSAIQQRRDAENAAYNENINAANTKLAEARRAINDTRTETEKLRDAWDKVKGSVDGAIRSMIEASLFPLSGGFGGGAGQSGYSSRYSSNETYATGGVIPGPIGAPRPILAHGGEIVLNPYRQMNLPARVQNTVNNVTNGGGRTVEVNINAPVYGVADLQNTIVNAIDAHERGLL